LIEAPYAHPYGTLSSFATPGWSRTDLFSEAQYWSAQGGGQVLAQTPSGLQTIPIGGGPVTTIDPQGSPGNGLITSDGANVIYTSATGDLRRSPVVTASPLTLIPGTLSDSFHAWYLSPDGTAAVIYDSKDNSLGLASTSVPGPPNEQLPGTTNAYAGTFTDDSSHALFFEESYAVPGTANMFAMAVGNAAPIAYGPTVISQTFPVGSSRIAFGDSVVLGSNGTVSSMNIELADTAVGPQRTTLVTQADPSFFVTPSKSGVVYVQSNQPGPNAGIYVMPIP
jgi:hypothetical protein